MPEFKAVATKRELAALDEGDIFAGYLAGLGNAPAPGSDRSKGFWHGWRNGMVDGGHQQIDHAQRVLAHEIVCGQRAH